MPNSRVRRYRSQLAHAGAFVVALTAASAASGSDPEEIIVTATRSEAEPFELPLTTQSLSARELREQIVRTVPEALDGAVGVFVQRTANGQGSPYLRGATGFRTLVLVDGIRINNSVFRSGANQYSATLDPLTAERVEVVMGPGSVLFGSDAVGGTINLITRSAPVENEAALGGRLHYRYDSSDSGDATRAEIRRTFSDWRGGLLLGGSFKRYADVEAGGPSGKLPHTGYREYGFDGRLDLLLEAPALALTLASYSFDQDDIERTHSTIYAVPFRGTEVGTDRRRRLDQLHRLHYARATLEPELAWLDLAQLTFSLQEVREVEDRIRASGARTLQGFEVWTTGVDLQLATESSLGRWTAGIEWYRDFVESSRRDFSPTGATTVLPRGVVAGDATYDTFGVYAQLEAKPFAGLLLTAGLRLAGAHARATRVDPNPLDARGFAPVDETFTSVVGAAGASYAVTERLRVFATIGQGFRAPNLSDLTRFDVARSGEVEVPAPNLRPERALQLEAGLKWYGDGFNGQLGYFHTFVRDEIARFPTGERAPDGWVVEKANLGDGHYTGIEGVAAFRLGAGLSAEARITWITGKVDTFSAEATEAERRRATGLMPTTGRLQVRWDSPAERFFAEVSASLIDDVSRLSPEEMRDTQRVPPSGLPGYSLFETRFGWRVTQHFTVNLSAANLSDVDYRLLGSGLNQPGRHVVLGLDWQL